MNKILVNDFPVVMPYKLDDDGVFPNSIYPALHYWSVFKIPSFLPVFRIKRMLAKYKWTNTWVGGIYEKLHYHSNTHELLCVVEGSITMRLGGESGVELLLKKGDLLLIPAGVAHQNIHASQNFNCIGFYPKGLDFDMNFGLSGERPQTDENISKVPIPVFDPLMGKKGKLQDYWHAASILRKTPSPELFTSL